MGNRCAAIRAAAARGRMRVQVDAGQCDARHLGARASPPAPPAPSTKSDSGCPGELTGRVGYCAGVSITPFAVRPLRETLALKNMLFEMMPV